MSEETILNEEAIIDNTENEETVQKEGTTTTDAAAWYLSEGIEGEGETPEWFKDGKYKTVEEQAKAYTNLESKLGAFTGAPKDGYDVVLPESLQSVEIPDDDPLLNQFNEWAAKAGLSQDAHTELLGVYVDNMIGAQPNVEDEVKRLGPDAKQRISDMVQWGQANLDNKDFEVMQSLAITAEGFQLLEKMRSLSRETKISQADNIKPTASNLTQEKLYEMVAKPEYETSPAYRAEVDAKFKEFFGNAPAAEIRQ